MHCIRLDLPRLVTLALESAKDLWVGVDSLTGVEELLEPLMGVILLELARLDLLAREAVSTVSSLSKIKIVISHFIYFNLKN